MGTGYTRQSAADIITGANIIAAPLNAEFNAIQAAFNSSSGHSHDGTSGEGPLIDLTTSITGLLPAANGGFSAIHKVDATTAPTANEDSGDGYGPGSVWVDVTNDVAYVCLDGTATAAVWRQISFESTLADIEDLLPTDGNIIVGDGSNWVAESGATARASLGLTIGTDVQAWDAQLDDIAALAVTDGSIIVGNGTNWVAESGATARTSLGVAIGSDVQAWDANLDQIAALTPSLNYFIVGNGTAWGTADASASRTALGLGDLAVLSTVATSKIDPASLVTEAEGISSNDNDTTWPTSAAVKDYVDTQVGGVGFTIANLNDVTITSIASGELLKWNGSGWVNNTLAEIDAELGAIAGLTSAADSLPYFTGSGTASLATFTTFARTLLDDGDAATARGTLSALAATDTITDCISGIIQYPDDISYKLVVKAPTAGTITETTTISTSGTCTATFKVNTTALGGTANSVSTVEQSQAHASSNTFSAGDDIVVTISSNSSCEYLSFTIKYTRALS